MKCQACRGSGRSAASGRFTFCDECFGHGHVFEKVPTIDELAALGFVGPNGSPDIGRCKEIIGKWEKYFRENPDPKPRAERATRFDPPTMEELLAAGHDAEVANVIYTREHHKASLGIKPYGDREEADVLANLPPSGTVQSRGAAAAVATLQHTRLTPEG